MDFDGALRYLAEHDNLEATPGGPTAGVVHGLSLERMTGIAAVLGDPQHAAPVIQVTGTNGKGSTARMITALLGAHGLTVGTYASPHLESITERIRRNADTITEEQFAEVMGEIAGLEPLFPARPSYFDLLTAAAYSWFAREAVEVVVAEVGMLGRYDSTNVARADVAVITNVGRDHTDGVGDWRRAIAEEKAGIIEDDSAVIVGETHPDLIDVFRAEGGSLHWVRNRDFGARNSRVAVGGRVADLYTPMGDLREVFLPLHGRHQVDNAAAAVAAVETFFDRRLDLDVVIEGLGSVEAPGRFEVVGRSPLVVLDMAHNPDGTASTATTYEEEFGTAGRLHLVTGLLRGRDPVDTLAPLLALGPARVVCTTADSARAVPAEEVAAVVRDLVGRSGESVDVVVDADVAGATLRAVEALDDVDALIVVGSVYVVGTARSALRSIGML